MGKGMVGLFVIIGIVLVILVLLLLQLKVNPDFLKPNPEDYQEQLQSCTEDNVDTALNEILKSGGDINAEDYLAYKEHRISKELPSIEDLKHNLAELIYSKIESDCKIYPNASYGRLEVDIEIKKKLYIKLDWEIRVFKGTESYNLKPVSLEYEIDIPSLFGYAKLVREGKLVESEEYALEKINVGNSALYQITNSEIEFWTAV